MILALIGALLIGISLGLLGSGGSILTVPVLVYVLHHAEKAAMAESLAIVGAIALFGAAQHAIRKTIDWRSVIYFGLPGVVGAYAGAFIAGYVPGPALLAIFAVVMLIAAVMMLRPPKLDAAQSALRPPHSPMHARWRIAIDGLLVGAITGMVGAGGGFLIVPALVLLRRLPMHVAVGTSLCIIAMKSAAGFVKYLDVVQREALTIDWMVVGLFIALGAIGSVAGTAIGGRTNQAVLRTIFGWFILAMGAAILARETLRLL